MSSGNTYGGGHSRDAYVHPNHNLCNGGGFGNGGDISGDASNEKIAGLPRPRGLKPG
jgi:hypothetical protein